MVPSIVGKPRWSAALGLVLQGLVLQGLVLLGVAGVDRASATPVPADDPRIRYMGRVDLTDPQAPRLDWPGTAIRARFEGTFLAATFEDETGANRIAVSIDGGPPTTLKLSPTPTRFVLASGLADGVHEVEIMKKTEGCCGARSFSFRGLELDPGKDLVALPPRPELRLELYGDSNQAGYSCECTCDSGGALHKSAYDAYPAAVSRLLGAEFHSMAWSGIGIVSGFAGQPMGQVWTRVLQSRPEPTWDFSRYQPDAIVINLGANDYYAGETPAEIMAGWESFVRDQLRPVYPTAHIVLANAYGWAFGEPADYVHLSVESLRARGDARVSYLRFPWLWGQEHAVACEHAGFANLVAAHLADVLGLDPPPSLDYSCLGAPGEITNHSFERLRNGEPTVADGWRASIQGEGRATVISDPARARTGDRFQELAVGAGGSARVSQSTDAAPGSIFEGRAHVLADAGSDVVSSLVFSNQGQGEVGRAEVVTSATGTWQAVAIEGTAPAGTWQVALAVRVEEPSTTIRVDDVELRAAFLFGDGFGSGSLSAWDRTASRLFLDLGGP